MNRGWFKTMGRIVLCSLLPLQVTACAEIQVKPVPPPAPTAKLRVYVQPISAQLPHGHWQTPHEDFVQNQVGIVERQLRKTGIYQVVSDEDVAAALGDQMPTRWQLARNDWELTRRIGRALHADYALIVERGARGGQDYFWETVLVNVESGREFGVLIPIRTTRDKDENRRSFKAAARVSYPELFKDAKQDMLATALRKGRQMSLAQGEAAPKADAALAAPNREQERLVREKEAAERTAREQAAKEQATKEKAAREQAARDREAAERIRQAQAAERERLAQEKTAQEKAAQEKRLAEAAARAKAETERAAAEAREAKRLAEQEKVLQDAVLEASAPAAAGGSRVVDLAKIIDRKAQQSTGERIVVYDFEASTNYRPVALILSESLREEVSKLNGFQLLNRENLDQVLQEQKLQQSGLIDEQQAVELGKGMAARQIMTGRFGALGKSVVLQAKRVDVETLGVLGMQSLKCSQGEEEQLLERMPVFARELTRKK